MTRFISLLIERSHRRLVGFMLWLLTFVVALAAAALFTAHQVGDTMVAQANADMAQFIRLRENMLTTFDTMDKELTAEPCSPEFHEQMRKVAFLPDGINEFLYAPNGIAECSVIENFAPVSLGVPDMRGEGVFSSLWFGRDLGFLGLEGLTGTIATRGAYGMIVPKQRPGATLPSWMSQQVVLVAPNGRWWHSMGEPGVYEKLREAGPTGRLLPLHNSAFYALVCDALGVHCIATEATLGDLFATNSLTVVTAVLICALVALGAAGQIHGALRGFWAFEARFRRHFKLRNIVCVYQPVMALESGAIVGCEVLVRWRDLDGTLVFPDQFLPVVEKHGLGMQLTRFVVERAHEELRDLIPANRNLQVNFNIFPRDLDAARLREVLAVFEDTGNRFSLVVEIVESDEVDMNSAQREIALLREYGIRTHLDDFGTGYSNLEHLGALALDGVKVDRSFAMAPQGTLMDKMLTSAIEMIHSAGRRITIEGVETEDRLQMLKATGLVDFVQGYLISRPLDIGRFAQFLAEQGVAKGQRPRLVA
jgi:sensor c-di-GMP phosphodiesterase-like protein